MQTITDPLGKPYSAEHLTYGTGRRDHTATCQACNDEGVIPVFGPGGYLLDEVDCHCTRSTAYDLAA